MNAVNPNFMIAGAAKCGTTSLYYYLRQHPDVFMPEMKEPHFFSGPCPLTWAPKTKNEYLQLFSEGEGKKAIGEATADYLYVAEAPGQIFEMFGGKIKFVVILRNPVDMMASMWEHCFREGWEKRSIKNALLSSTLDDPETKEAWQAHWMTLYIKRAQYSQQLERLYSFFPSEQVKVFIFEEFFDEGLPYYAELCRFLNIADDHYPVERVQNKGVGVRDRNLVRFFHHYYPKYIFPLIKFIVPHSIRKKVKSKIVSIAVQRGEKWNEEVREELQKRLHGSVRNLEKLLNRDLSEVWF